jgi:PAS domain S-box-containing protein
VVFLDNGGRKLLDSAAGDELQPKGEELLWRGFLPKKGTGVQFYASGENAGARIVITIPYYFKGRHNGFILAWLSPADIYSQFLSSSSAKKNPIALIFEHSHFYAPSEIEEAIPLKQLKLAGSLESGDVMLVPSSETDTLTCEMTVFYALIPSTPFSLVTFIPSAPVGRASPRQLAAVSAGIGVLLLAGSIVIIRSSTRNTVLNARLEEVHIREHATKEQNRLLQEANRAAEAARLAAEASEHAKTESEQRWLFALEGSGDGVWDWDYPSGTVFYSRRFKEMLGYAEDEIGTGLNELTDRVHPACSDAIRSELHRYLNGETPYYAGEFRMLCRDGSYRWILTRGMVVSRAADGSIVRIIGTHSDITTRKQVEETLHEQALMLEEEVAQRQLAQESLAVKQVQLQALNETLEARVAEELHKNREKDGILLQQDKLASIGQLAAGVAHEINNPMGFIMSNLRTLKKYTDVEQQYLQALEEATKACCPEEQNKQLDELHKRLDIGYVLEDIPPLITESIEGTERIKQIVLDLKDFARSDENSLKETDLNQCVQSTVNIVRNEIKYVADLNLQLGNIPPIICNPQQINQVIANLLLNAAHAINGHGSITVSTSAESDKVLLTVADTGCGIPDEIRKRVFDPFFTTKEVGKGTGLGLSISYDIVTKHGGEISLESEPGVGTTFMVRLPISGPGADGQLAPPSGPA